MFSEIFKYDSYLARSQIQIIFLTLAGRRPCEEYKANLNNIVHWHPYSSLNQVLSDPECDSRGHFQSKQCSSKEWLKYCKFQRRSRVTII